MNASSSDEPQLDFQAFVDGYITCMLWSSHDESDEAGGAPMDLNYTEDDIPSEDRQAIEADCRAFTQANAALLEQAVDRVGYDSAQAGHDFWLTREGHGAGYWDRPMLKAEGLGEALTQASKMFGEHPEGGPWVEDGRVRYGRAKVIPPTAPAPTEEPRARPRLR